MLPTKHICTFPLPTSAPTVEQCFIPALTIVLVNTGLTETVQVWRTDGQCPELEGGKAGGERYSDGEEGQEGEYDYQPEPYTYRLPTLTTHTLAPTPSKHFFMNGTRYTDFTRPGGKPALIPRGYAHKRTRPRVDLRTKVGWKRQRERVSAWDSLEVISERTEPGSSARGSSVGGEVGMDVGMQEDLARHLSAQSQECPCPIHSPERATGKLNKKRSRTMEVVQGVKKVAQQMRKMPSFDKKRG
ncbi:hypothetical protein IAR50_003090 [Cryptococcus sp. DSM 104548]